MIETLLIISLFSGLISIGCMLYACFLGLHMLYWEHRHARGESRLRAAIRANYNFDGTRRDG